MVSIGEQLAEARRQQGKSLKDAERATRIRARYLQALEDDDFSSLPGSTYARAFIREYADFLKLDGSPLVNSFNERHNPVKREQPIKSDVVMPMRRRQYRTSQGSKRAPLLIAVGVVAVLLIGWLVVGMVRGNGAERTTKNRTQVVNVEKSPGAVSEKAPRAKLASSAGKSGNNVSVAAETVGRDGCWARVTADGKLVFEGVLEAGTKQTWAAKDKIVIRVGNAAALKVAANGESARVLGEEGLVVEETFNKDSK